MSRGGARGRMMRRTAFCAGLFTALAVIGAAHGPAAAGVGIAADKSLIRVAHLSPDTPGVDVYVDGQRALGNVGFNTVSDYKSVPPGPHRLELRPAGAAADSTPAIDVTVSLQGGDAYT